MRKADFIAKFSTLPDAEGFLAHVQAVGGSGSIYIRGRFPKVLGRYPSEDLVVVEQMAKEFNAVWIRVRVGWKAPWRKKIMATTETLWDPTEVWKAKPKDTSLDLILDDIEFEAVQIRSADSAGDRQAVKEHLKEAGSLVMQARSLMAKEE